MKVLSLVKTSTVEERSVEISEDLYHKLADIASAYEMREFIKHFVYDGDVVNKWIGARIVTDDGKYYVVYAEKRANE